MNTLELLGRRTSVRTYDPRPVDAFLRDTLMAEAAAQRPPFGTRPRFVWVEADEARRKDLGAVASYGMIKGAGLYLAGAIPNRAEAVFDYGWVLEAVVLKATDLGLGTCWMGGTFDRSTVADPLELEPTDIIPAVTPVGWASGQGHWQGNLAAALSGARSRKAPGALATGLAEGAPWRDALEAVRLGPSASNRQPWRLVGDANGKVRFYLEETPGYDSAFRSRHGFSIQALDLGIAFLHWDRTLADHGITGTWDRTDAGVGIGAGPAWKYVATWAPQA